MAALARAAVAQTNRTGQPFTIVSPDPDTHVFEVTPGQVLPLTAVAAFEAFGEAIGMGDVTDVALDLVKFVTAGDIVIVVYAAWVPVVDRRLKGDDGLPLGQVQQLVTKRVTNAPIATVATLIDALYGVLTEVA